VSSVILLSIEETVRPPAWWININHRSVPSSVDKKALQTARDSLQRFLERISMVTKMDPFILENKTNHMSFVGVFRMF
jgi:hypothetical protein